MGTPNLILQGYGFWHRVKEAIKAVVSRLLPKKRVKVLMKVRVTGDTYFPMHEIATYQVSGKKDFRRMLFEILEDESDEDQ